MKCKCGNKTNKIRYLNGLKTCSKCENNNLSGNWIRKAELERDVHKKDILQRYNKDGSPNKEYVQAYGEPQEYRGATHKYK